MREIDNKKIVLVDFDGTLINTDSLFLIVSKKISFVSCYLFVKLIIKYFILNFTINLSKVKEVLFEAMFSGQTLKQFKAFCHDFSNELHKFDNVELINKINEYKSSGFEIYIVSASPSDWIKPWADAFCICNIIGTELEISHGLLSGKFSTKNCKGKEKVSRINAFINTKDCAYIVAYGNSKSDYPMLSIADESFIVKRGRIIPFPGDS